MSNNQYYVISSSICLDKEEEVEARVKDNASHR